MTKTISDAENSCEITATTIRFMDKPNLGELADRAAVCLTVTDVNREEDVADVNLQVEDAILLGLELLRNAANAMAHDPRPWKIDRADFYAAEAALETRQHYRKKNKPIPPGESEWAFPETEKLP